MRTMKTDQAAQMLRLIQVFVERMYQKVHFLALQQISGSARKAIESDKGLGYTSIHSTISNNNESR